MSEHYAAVIRFAGDRASKAKERLRETKGKCKCKNREQDKFQHHKKDEKYVYACSLAASDCSNSPRSVMNIR